MIGSLLTTSPADLRSHIRELLLASRAQVRQTVNAEQKSEVTQRIQPTQLKSTFSK